MVNVLSILSNPLCRGIRRGTCRGGPIVRQRGRHRGRQKEEAEVNVEEDAEVDI